MTGTAYIPPELRHRWRPSERVYTSMPPKFDWRCRDCGYRVVATYESKGLCAARVERARARAIA